MNRIWRKLGVVAGMLALALSLGCEGDGDSGGGNGDFVGTWYVVSDSGSEGFYYVHFRADGTYDLADCADCGPHVSGTYAVTDGTAAGPFKNPGVGDGEIEATITDGVMHLKFIEHWHSPYKVIPYSGGKQ